MVTLAGCVRALEPPVAVAAVGALARPAPGGRHGGFRNCRTPQLICCGVAMTYETPPMVGVEPSMWA